MALLFGPASKLQSSRNPPPQTRVGHRAGVWMVVVVEKVELGHPFPGAVLQKTVFGRHRQSPRSHFATSMDPQKRALFSGDVDRGGNSVRLSALAQAPGTGAGAGRRVVLGSAPL